MRKPRYPTLKALRGRKSIGLTASGITAAVPGHRQHFDEFEVEGVEKSRSDATPTLDSAWNSGNVAVIRNTGPGNFFWSPERFSERAGSTAMSVGNQGSDAAQVRDKAPRHLARKQSGVRMRRATRRNA